MSISIVHYTTQLTIVYLHCPLYHLINHCLSLLSINHHLPFIILILGVFVASSGAYVSVFQEVLHNSGYAKYQGLIGYLGASMAVASIIGLIAASKWIDYTKRF